MSTEHFRVDQLMCLRCEIKMLYAGVRQYHEGKRYGVIGDIGEWFVQKDKFYLYICPTCSKTELFVSKPTLGDPMSLEVSLDSGDLNIWVHQLECLSCNMLIPKEADKCPHCGWTWNE